MIPPHQGWQSYTHIATVHPSPNPSAYTPAMPPKAKASELVSDGEYYKYQSGVTKKRSHEDGTLEEEMHRHLKRIQVEEGVSQTLPPLGDFSSTFYIITIRDIVNFLVCFFRTRDGGRLDRQLVQCGGAVGRDHARSDRTYA